MLAPAAWAQSAAGLWDAAINYNGTDIPFRLEIAGDGINVKGWFFNGKDREVSSSGNLEGGHLQLNFDSYLAKLNATIKDGTLEGEYGPILKRIYKVRATRAAASEPQTFDPAAPSIGGIWDLEGVSSGKREKTWRLILQQSGSSISGAILRVDGDTGTLEGGWKNGKFTLSHFDGARASLLILKPAGDGTLDVSLSGGVRGFSEMKAVRPEEARAKGLPPPADADLHTSVKDPNAPFPFSFPDLNGNLVSNTDPRFRGKVVLVEITGSWCPNCHDEAPFLQQVYTKYHDRGLEVVALSFEEPDQLQNPTRLRALIREYGVKFTVLLGGETDSAKTKLTQAVDWDAWPTTFFIGRDGLVHAVHAGFPSPGSGELYKKETEEFVARVEKLLAENPVQASR